VRRPAPIRRLVRGPAMDLLAGRAAPAASTATGSRWAGGWVPGSCGPGPGAAASTAAAGPGSHRPTRGGCGRRAC